MIHRTYLKAVVAAARSAHPNNRTHRKAWMGARMYLDARGLSPCVPIGKGREPTRMVNELSRWEKAARLVC